MGPSGSGVARRDTGATRTPKMASSHGQLEFPPTPHEKDLARRIGRLDILMGGPPCQGHSTPNNHSRRDDPRNALYLKMARAAEVLSPTAIVAEGFLGARPGASACLGSGPPPAA